MYTWVLSSYTKLNKLPDIKVKQLLAIEVESAITVTVKEFDYRYLKNFSS